MTTVFERVDYLRHGRAWHTWLSGMGIASDTVKKIKDRIEPPSELVLTAIARCENASFIWLHEGTGAPYRIAVLEDDDECAEVLSDFLFQEPWLVHLVDDGNRKIIVLTMPAAFERARSGFVDYTAVEILTPAGDKTVSEAALNGSAFKTATISADEMDNIVSGNVGAYGLIGDDKTEGLLSHAELVSMRDRLELYAYPVELPEAISEQEKHDKAEPKQNPKTAALLSLFTQLDEEAQSLVIQMLERITHKDGK